jgi:hypothetical protein
MNDMRSSRVREQFYPASSLTNCSGRGGLRHTFVWESGEHGFTLLKKLSRAERVRLEELTTTDDAIIYPYPSEVFPVRLQFIRLHQVINAAEDETRHPSL